ncbi:MAG: tetratricopeptide repeat protein [Deltaproteobacteria bacterium]|nr:tetratricopeptide repeat protein [Deltaproteobacteria bacterium]
MSLFSRAHRPDRKKAERLVTEGYVHFREGRLDEALSRYEAARKADHGLAVAHLDAGLCRLDLYNRDAARLDAAAREAALSAAAEALDAAVAHDPTSWRGWRALANVLERRLQWAAAEDAWAKVVTHAPADGTERAEAQRAVAALAHKAAADRARQGALAALKDDRSADAQRAAATALVPFLDEATIVPRARALAGTLWRRAGELGEARRLLEAAVVEDADDVEALRELASVCLAQGDLDAALRASLDAYRRQPTDAGLVCNVGVCHLGLGALDEAAEYIDIAARLDPDDPIIQRAKEALARASRPS